MQQLFYFSFDQHTLQYEFITVYVIGTGYATMTIVFLLDVYYCVIVAWTFFYLASCFLSFPTLPWENCGESRPNLEIDLEMIFS